uniref:cyanoalanine nitrilase n=1 Tax=Ananas comosus var. bracteatus TaxID=296719 RepID=A0A6V7QKR6_ANACO|nr:unnamed protein product [Ananas comosus var. bracteatus]
MGWCSPSTGKQALATLCYFGAGAALFAVAPTSPTPTSPRSAPAPSPATPSSATTSARSAASSLEPSTNNLPEPSSPMALVPANSAAPAPPLIAEVEMNSSDPTPSPSVPPSFKPPPSSTTPRHSRYTRRSGWLRRPLSSDRSWSCSRKRLSAATREVLRSAPPSAAARRREGGVPEVPCRGRRRAWSGGPVSRQAPEAHAYSSGARDLGFGDGSTIPVYETPLGKIGALICWENRMPLLRTALYGKGIEIYCAPTADAREVWQASMAHIALEGGCFVLSANQFCRRKDYPPPPEYVFAGLEDEPSSDTVVCAGGSVIISPSGAVLAGPNYEGEALISADLDLGEIVRAKFDFDVVGHYARPEVLSLTVKDHPLNPVSFASAAKSESSQKS